MKAGWKDIDNEDLHNPARGVRLQRVLADLGVGARRTCEKIIEAGRVEINGKVVQKLPIFVDPGRDHIAVDGRPLPKTAKSSRRVYVMLHKPERTLTVSTDEPGADRRTVLDLVQHPSAPRLYPVGRLEYEATGLVLLTNDGDLANRLSHPRFGVAKVYHAVVKGEVPEAKLAELEAEIFDAERKAARTQTRMAAAGVTFKGEVPRQLRTSKPIKGIYRSAHVKLSVVKRAPGKTMLEITMTEGRNRHVEGILAAHGFSIRKMTQVGLGPLELSALALGAWRELEREEIIALLQSVKERKGGKPRGSKDYKRKASAKAMAGRPIPQRSGGHRGGRAPEVAAEEGHTPGPRDAANRRDSSSAGPAKRGDAKQNKFTSPAFEPPVSRKPSELTSNRRPRVIGGKKPPG